MRAEFYIVSDSFQMPEHIDLAALEEKIKALGEDYGYIRKYKATDKILVHEAIYDTFIYEDLTVADALYTPRGKQLLDRDALQQLRNIIEQSEETDISVKEVVDELLPEHNENLVHALLCLHEIEGIKPEFLVYDKHNWLTFHRFFLGLYPKNPDFYIAECIKYFPDLYFHQNNYESIRPLFPNFVQKIIFHLAALNDDFRRYQNTPYQRIETLTNFSIGCKLDETASAEGNAKRKDDFTFSFKNKYGEMVQVCCEPHLKLCRSDRRGDGNYYFHRIYFHEGDHDIADGRVLVGHIGKHL